MAFLPSVVVGAGATGAGCPRSGGKLELDIGGAMRGRGWLRKNANSNALLVAVSAERATSASGLEASVATCGSPLSHI